MISDFEKLKLEFKNETTRVAVDFFKINETIGKMETKCNNDNYLLNKLVN